MAQNTINIVKQLSKGGVATIMILLIGLVGYSQYNMFKLQENHINHNTESINSFIQVTQDSNEVIRANTATMEGLKTLIETSLKLSD